MTKRMLNNSMHVTMEEALDDEGLSQTVNFGTNDTTEAMKAFLDKRDPNFQGRALAADTPPAAHPFDRSA